MRKLKRYKDGRPKVKQRRGVRKNPDGTVSSHLMRAEYIPERGWVGFPSLFQDSKPYADDQQNWVDMSEEEDWMKIYEEAERRGEVYDFGEDKEAALAFGEGSWKDQLPEREPEEELYNMERARELGYERDGSGHLPSVDEETGMFLKSMDHPTAFKEYMYGQLNKDIGINSRVVVNPEGPFGDKQLQYVDVELTDEEFEQYKAGGYVLEELSDGGEDDLITYKNNKKLIDGVADWNWSSDVEISSAYNDQIKARLLTGNYGYNPKTGELVKLGKSQQTKVTDKEVLDTKKALKETAGMSSKEYEIFQDNEKEAARQRLVDDYTSNKHLVYIDKVDDWNVPFALQDEYGRTFNTQNFAGQQVYMTDAEEKAYKKAKIDYNAPIMHDKINTAFSVPASFTPAGLGIMGVQGAANLALKSGPEFVENPSWSNAGWAGLDLLMTSPVVIPAGISAVKGVNNLRNVKLPSPKMDPNKLAATYRTELISNPPKPSLQIKSTMPGGPFEKQLSKTGEINVKNIQAHINKADVSKQDKFILQKTLDENFAGQTKINYEDFKTAVSENLAPLKKTIVGDHASFGINRLNYKTSSNLPVAQKVEKNSLNQTLKRIDNDIKNIDYELNNLQRQRENRNILERIDPISNYVGKGSHMQWEIKYLKGRKEKLLKEKQSLIKNDPNKIVDLNETVLYGNADELGRGSGIHFENNPETLGHSRVIVTGEEPEVMHFIETQSDWAQHGRKIDVNRTKRLIEKKNKELESSKKYQKDVKDAYEKGENFEGYPVHSYQVEGVERRVIDRQNELIELQSRLKNPDQKNFLLDFHQERLLQENMLHAAENGNTIVRYPTSETAAKIQGYTPEIIEKQPSLQTIMNKYKNTPKTVKKILGVDVKILNDVKGNSWYEWSIPEDFLQGTRPIRGLKKGGYLEAELTPEEADKYRDGGYVLEELKDGGGTYTVKSGDTFNGIALANGISPTELAAANPKIGANKRIYIGQVLSIPNKQVAVKTPTKVAKKSGVTSAVKKSIQSMPSAIDLDGLKKGIAHVESADGTLMMNPTSSATGLYGQLYNEIKDLPELKGVTREQFAKDIDLQNKIFEKRFYEGLPGVPALQKNAEDLYKEYSPQIKNFSYSKEDIVALSNFLGRQGTRNYFGSIRDSKKFKAPGINKTPTQYLEGTRPSYISKEEDGGFIEIDLSDEEAQVYADGGYVVEELSSYEGGGPNPNPLQEWNKIQKQRWSGVKEWDPAGKSTLREYNKRMGVSYNPNDHWSAITISNAVMANSGANNKDEIRALGFNPTKSHSGYVSDAFATNADPDYKYNKYIAEKPTADLNYNIGDILVKGRKDGKKVGTSKWSYEDFATHGSGYVSHGDIIVDKGSDDKGDYVIIAGGNLGDTYKNRKVYTNNINSKYKVKLKDRLKTESLQNTDDSNTDDYLSFDDGYQPSKKTKFNESMPIAQYSSSLVNDTPNNLFNNNALFGNNLLLDGSALGVAYTPYQNPFLNLENNTDEIINSNLSTDENLSSSLNESFDKTDKADKTDEIDKIDENNLEDESVKNSFNSRILKNDELHRLKYSKDQKNKISELENEIKTLQSNMLSEINSISESEIDQASTKEEKKKAALKRYKTIMNLTGFNVRGEDANEIEAVTKKYKQKEEKLRSKLEQVKQEFDLNIKDSPINQEIKKYEASLNTYEKKTNAGHQWISVQDPIYKSVALQFENLYGGEDNGMVSLNPDSPVYIQTFNPKSSKNVYDNLAKGQENNKDKEEFLKFGKYYGDGSLHYGVWVDEDYYPVDKYLYPSIPEDPYNMASGRVEPMINLENAINALSYYIAPGFSLASDAGLTDPDRYFQGYDPNRESQPIFGSVFKDIKENPQNYSQRPYKSPGFIESLPQIWENIKGNFEDGGYVVDLNKDEVAQYAQKGYIVEEIK